MKDNQFPRIMNVPGANSDAAIDVISLMREYGRQYDPWQRYALSKNLGREESTTWAAFEACLVAPRQNGKNEIIEGVELAAVLKWGVKTVVHTAHELSTTEDAFNRMCVLIENTPELAQQTKINRSNGKESIVFDNGAVIKYVARSKAKGRGWTEAELIVFDEAMMHLESAMLRALIPSMAVGPNPQIWYLASGGLDESDQLLHLRRRALAGDDDLAYLEWSALPPDDGSPVDVEDRDLWYQANPALGIRITERFLSKSLRTLGPEGFAFEHLCIWPAGAGGAVDPETWNELEDEESQAGDDIAFGVALSPDGTSASLAMAGWRPDGRMHVELVDRWPGAAWVPYRGAELGKRWRPVGTFVCPDERTAGLATPKPRIGWRPEIVSGEDMAAACKAIQEDVQVGRLCHVGQSALSSAVAGARRRSLDEDAAAGVWVWDAIDPSVDIAPWRAVTLAAHGLRGGVSRRRRRKTGRAGSV